MRAATCWALVAATATPAIARAQGSDLGVRVGVSVGAQLTSAAVSQDFSVTKNVEPAPVAVEIPLDQAPIFEVGGWVRLAGRLGAGVSFSRISRTAGAAVTAGIPHPFYIQQARAISGTQPGAAEEENALHIDVVAVAAATNRIELTFFGGPTVFNTKQDLVTDVSYADAYPYDTATFSGARLARQSASKVGYHLGADATWSLTEQVGVGGLVRFSRASADYSASSANQVTVDLGGLQAAAGIRFRF